MSSLLEKYLREVTVQLHELPAEEREEEIEEIRVHIEAYIDQHKASGKSDAEAEQAALFQFGDASKVGRDIRRARSRQNFRAIGLMALIMLAVATAISYLAFREMVIPTHASGFRTALALLQAGETLFMGCCVGIILRRLAVKWIAWYYAITLIPTLAIVQFPARGIHMKLMGMAADTGIEILIGVVRIGIAFAGAWIGAKIAERLIGRARPVAIR